MADWITIDGSEGEGGGQILRTSLTLSLITGKPFRIENIRAARAKPGLLRQHLTAVQGAAKIGSAAVSGADVGSRELSFAPSHVAGGEYHLAIGSAGSAMLVLQTLLPALLCAREASRLTIEGGTHNPLAPPFEFAAKTFLPVLRRMGASVEARLEAHGFYPAGGGRVVTAIDPTAKLMPVTLLDRGPARVTACALVSALPDKIGKRELSIVRERLLVDRSATRTESVTTSIGPGNVLFIVIEGESVTEVVTGFGMKNVTAEQVAAGACDEAERYLRANVPVGEHLADQLLIPMALAGGGAFRTLTPTQHTLTNARVIQRFLDVAIEIEAETPEVSRITVGGRTRTAS
jgi:RNA 3'-terminal phosphate cyclase (ATP)